MDVTQDDHVVWENISYQGPPNKVKQRHRDRTITKRSKTDRGKFRQWCLDNGGQYNRLHETLGSGREGEGETSSCVFSEDVRYSDKWDRKVEEETEYVRMDSYGRIEAQGEGDVLKETAFKHYPADRAFVGPNGDLHSEAQGTLDSIVVL